MTATPKSLPTLKLQCVENSVCRTPPSVGEADTLREETDDAPGGHLGVRVQAPIQGLWR
jgi:hypothetical protein